MPRKKRAYNKKKVKTVQSTIVTRSKLSLQKKLEKEKLETNPKSTSNTLEQSKKSETNVLPKESKKTEKLQNAETIEFCPDKKKRDKVVKKIVLKPKHKLSIIGPSNDSKRKGNESEDEEKTSTAKRKRIKSNEMSQIPDDEEIDVIMRMRDVNQNLTDEDLMEILTCPSPVWWEDPPDESFVEDPILLKSAEHASSTEVERRIKHPRKRTPHKVIIEPEHSEDKTDFTETLNNKNKFDNKFNNKRSKLENLLSTIKDKLIPKTDIDESESDKKPQEDVVNKKAEIQKDSSENLDEELVLHDISPIDSDCLERLENMVIPIEKNVINEINETADDNTNKLSKDNPMKSNVYVNNKVKRKSLKKQSRKKKPFGIEIIHNYSIKDKPNKEISAKVVDEIDLCSSSDESTEPSNYDVNRLEEYVEVYEIIDKNNSDKLEEDLKKVDLKAVFENECTDKGKLNSYYKICKAAKVPKIIDLKRPADEFCDDCERDNGAGAVRDAGDVKYCLNCSCIFDMGECSYCAKRDMMRETKGVTTC